MGGDRPIRYVRVFGSFQSTPPHGGRPVTSRSIREAHLFQSTPPHGGRRSWHHLKKIEGSVSIHAPAWGATEQVLNAFVAFLVSIHAPAWGATPLDSQ